MSFLYEPKFYNAMGCQGNVNILDLYINNTQKSEHIHWIFLGTWYKQRFHKMRHQRCILIWCKMNSMVLLMLVTTYPFTAFGLVACLQKGIDLSSDYWTASSFGGETVTENLPPSYHSPLYPQRWVWRQGHMFWGWYKRFVGRVKRKFWGCHQGSTLPLNENS